MFLIPSHHFARAVIVNMMRTEYGFVVVRPERIELLQVCMEFGRNILEIDEGVDV